jgi:hypothetical protein
MGADQRQQLAEVAPQPHRQRRDTLRQFLPVGNHHPVLGVFHPGLQGKPGGEIG